MLKILNVILATAMASPGMPNQSQVMSAFRWLLNVIGTSLIASGYVSDSFWGSVTAVAMALFPLFWGLIVHTTVAKVLAASEVKGVRPIRVGNDAPPAVKEIAEDPTIKSVVVAK